MDLVKILLCMFAGAFVPSDEVMSQELPVPNGYVAISSVSTPFDMTLVSEIDYSYEEKQYTSCLYAADKAPTVISMTVLDGGISCPRKEVFLVEMIPTVLSK